MVEHPLISVIVPVYNVEAYVEECVESLIAQTYPHVEIVLVDDGSEDSSGQICDRLDTQHENVTVYHKKNGGLSDARNYGLACCRGEWVSFVDSDDYVSPVFLSSLYEAAVDHGCAVAAVPGGKSFKDGDLCRLAEKIRPVAPQAPLGAHIDEQDDFRPVAAAPLSAREMIRKMLYQEVATGAQWRLYHRDALGDNPFPKGLYYEDLASTYKFVHRAGRVVLLDCSVLYAYRLRSTSIIRQSYRSIKARSALTVVEWLYADIAAWYPELEQAVASRCFSVCRMVYGQVPEGKSASSEFETDRKALWEVLERFRLTVLGDGNARKRERLAAAVACIGEVPFRIFCKLCRKVGRMQ